MRKHDKRDYITTWDALNRRTNNPEVAQCFVAFLFRLVSSWQRGVQLSLDTRAEPFEQSLSFTTLTGRRLTTVTTTPTSAANHWPPRTARHKMGVKMCIQAAYQNDTEVVPL